MLHSGKKEIAVYMNICMFGQPKEVITLYNKKEKKNGEKENTWISGDWNYDSLVAQ